MRRSRVGTPGGVTNACIVLVVVCNFFLVTFFVIFKRFCTQHEILFYIQFSIFSRIFFLGSFLHFLETLELTLEAIEQNIKKCFL